SCTHTFTTSESVAGTYTYTGYVYDAANNGAYTTPSALNVTVTAPDTTAPSVTQIFPSNDSAGKVSVTADIADASGILAGSAKVYYDVNPALGCWGAIYWRAPAAMSPASGSAYKATLPDTFKNNDSVCVKVAAKDASSNQNEASVTYPGNPYKVASATPLWTFMVYLNADNNLESAGVGDFLEMAQVNNPLVNIVVQFDRAAGYDTTYGDWQSAKRFLVTRGMEPTAANALSDLGETDMSNPNTLKDFVNWAETRYPAENYALIIWNHGGGSGGRAPKRTPGKQNALSPASPLKGVSCDGSQNDNCMTTTELGTSLSGVGHLDILVFDACLMQMLEVGYQIRNYADIMIGSEEIVGGDGMNYTTTLSPVAADTTPLGFAGIIFDKNRPSKNSSFEVLSSFYLGSSIANLANSAGALAQKLNAGMAAYSPQIKTARTNTQKFYYPVYSDLYHFASNIQSSISQTEINNAAKDVKNKLAAARINNENSGGDYANASGLSIYLPQSNTDMFFSEYTHPYLSFAKDTQWDEFLVSLTAGDSAPPSITQINPANDADGKVSVTAGITDTSGILSSSAKVYYDVNPLLGCGGAVYWRAPAAMSASGGAYKATLPDTFINNDSICVKVAAKDASSEENEASVTYPGNPYKVTGVTDTTPPVISQITPANDPAGKVSVTANIADASGILSGSAKVYYAVNPLLGCIWPYNWSSQAAMTVVSGSIYKAILPNTVKNDDSVCVKVEVKDASPKENAASERYPANPYKVSGVINYQSTTLLNNGPTREKVDIVFLGDGYTLSEMDAYRADVQAFMDYLFSQPPFSDYKSFINVHRVDIISNQSGTDNPNCNGVQVDTALDTGFSSTGSDCRLLFTYARAKVADAAAHAPASDTVIIIVNTPVYGGAASGYGVFYRGGTDVMAHELGHSFGWLADEYDYGGSGTYSGGEPSGPNVTINTNRATLKWGEWVQPATPLPTTTSASDTPGLYEGAQYSRFGIYRPTYGSKMRVLGAPFERINYGLLVERIFDYVPNDSTPPQASLTCGQSAGGTMPVTLAASDPQSYVMAYRISASASFADTAWQLASNKAAFTLNQPSWPVSASAGAQIYAQVRNGYGDDTAVSCSQSSVVSAISPDTLSVIPATLQNRSVTVRIQPNSFRGPVTVTIKTPRLLPSAADFSDRLKTTGISMEIKLDTTTQPAEYATIEIFYADTEVAGLNKADLVLARYDEAGKSWVTLESVSYPEINKVTGKTLHFSLFQVMLLRPLSGLSQARIYPNPFYPATKPQVTFAGLPAGTSVKLYTLQGELVWKGTANSSEIAEWPGVNRSGRAVASGLYIVYLESGGSRKTMKLSVVK
ncbi:MAG: T9SS type A sorting domain-containing protein, partial [Elusimicrobia bacterium]|nr:T9SS type A sorting domain-containing protein [Elusimicrobiota bacterium]